MADIRPNIANVTSRAQKVNDLGSDGFMVALAGGAALIVGYVLSLLIVHWFGTNLLVTHLITDTSLPAVTMFATSLRLRGGFRGLRLSRAIKLIQQRQASIVEVLEHGGREGLLPPEQLEGLRSRYRTLTKQLQKITGELDRRVIDTDLLADPPEEEKLELTLQDEAELADLLGQIQRELAARQRRDG